MFRLLGFIIVVSSVFFSTAFAAPTAQDFGKLPRIHDSDLSPDGNEIAVLVYQDGKHILRILGFSNLNDTSRLIALKPEMQPEFVRWVNDHRVIISFRQNEKIGRTPIKTGYLFTLDTRTMKGKILINPTKPDAQNIASTDIKFRQFNNKVVDWLDDDPDHILMTFGDHNLSSDLRKVHVATGRNKVIKRELDDVQTWYTDERGEPRVGKGRKERRGDWVLRIRDAESEKWRFSDDYPGLEADVRIYGFTSNPNELVIGDYQGRDTRGLYIYDLIAKKISRKLYHNDNYDATGVIRNAKTGDITGVKYTADTPQVELLGSNKSTLTRMREKFADSNIQFVDYSEDSDKTLFKVSNASDPGYLMVVGRGQEPKILSKLRPKVPATDLRQVIPVQYTARDGEKIPSYVTLPAAITETAQLKNLPFIVLPHGGPYARDSQRFDYFAQFFASRGYGVLQMNFRGSDGYGKSFKETGRENWVVMQEDVEDGTRWLIEKGYADPKRICIAGWSYGGYAALMGAAKNPELYNCAISVAGLTDIKGFIQDKKEYRFGKISADNFIGKGFEDKDDIAANTPIKVGAQMTTPVFLAHGQKDLVVQFSQFSRMKSALKKSKSKPTFMDFKHGNHSITREKDRQDLLQGIEDFLIKHNGKSEWMR